MWVNKNNNKISQIVPELNWAITLVVIVVVIISHQFGG
jgi:preprotein translocase subunit Sec61beta